jgi:hypothetical protein
VWSQKKAEVKVSSPGAGIEAITKSMLGSMNLSKDK